VEDANVESMGFAVTLNVPTAIKIEMIVFDFPVLYEYLTSNK